ncbi:MAG: DinB family protein [Candidatus Eisenbacteria bacterium]|nr:DinB family protein [Candidatus Eisenbacteria bacterium]
MPVSQAFAESSRLQRERLRALIARLDANQLAAHLPNGWTVAGALAHVALWDLQRLGLMRRWAARDMCGGDPPDDARKYDGDLFNDAAQPLLELIPPERAAAAALHAAEEIDAYLAQVPDEVVEMALARPDAPNLDRGSHRKHHLDIIEKALGESAR